MSVAARQFEAPRVLTYRPHIKWMHKACYAFGALFAVIGIALFAIISHLKDFKAGAISAFVLFAVSGELFFLGRFLIKPLSQAKIQIFEDSMTLFRMGKEIVIPFSSIVKVSFSSIPYIGGWFMIRLDNKKKYKFTVVLERSDYLLDAIHKARPGLCHEKKFFKYRRTAVYADHSWARLYEIVRRWPLLVLKYGLFPLASAFVIRARGLNLLAPTVYMAMPFYGYALYLLGEMIFAARVRKALKGDPNNVRRDVTRENALVRKLNWFYYITVSVGLALLFVK